MVLRQLHTICLVSSELVRLFGFVHAVEAVGHVEIGQVLDGVGRCVVMVVTRLVVLAEAVEVLHSQIEILKSVGT